LKSKPVILLFIDWYLPGYKAGGPITSCANLIGHLKDEFDFRVITRDTDYTETKPYPGIISNHWNTLPDGTEVYYFSEKELSYRNIKYLIRETKHDKIYLNGIYSRYFTIYPLLYARRKSFENVLIASRGMLAQSAIGVKRKKKKLFLTLSRGLGLFKSVVFHASTAAEKKDIEKEFGAGVKIRIAGNLGAMRRFSNNPFREKERGNLKLISIARIAPEKNLLYALQQLAKVHDLSITFDIYGPVYDKEYWESCLTMMKTLPKGVIVNYHGSIPSETVPELLSKSHFLFMPTQGENFGHIILQAFSSGCPVIISDQTPWKDLEKHKYGWDIPLSNPDEFVDALGNACSLNQEEFSKLSDHVFRYSSDFLLNPAAELENRKLFR